MARFDVYANRGGLGFLLDVQADLIARLNTRMVVPLLPLDAAPTPATRLNPIFEVLGACRAWGWVRVGSERGWRQGAKRSRVLHPASLCNAESAPFPVQPGGPGQFGAPFVVVGSLCGPATRPRRRLNWHPDLPWRGPVPKPDRLLGHAAPAIGRFARVVLRQRGLWSST